jgi:hypothetical protein
MAKNREGASTSASSYEIASPTEMNHLFSGATNLLAALLLSSCAADRDYRPVAPGEGPPVARYIDLREEPSISTFHFPRGVYSLEAEDNRGYYYRAPRQVMKHAFGGGMPYDGGIFVQKNRRDVIRGYVVWAGGRTKIGDLKRAAYSYRD